MSDEVRAGYDAPFPDDGYCAGRRRCLDSCRPPPTTPRRRPTGQAGPRSATKDTITGGMAAIFQSQMRGAQGRQHPVIRDAGHFLQEDAGEEPASHIVEFLRT
jgi:haloalkane dehalogenase